MLGEVLDTAVRRLRETGALCEQEPTTGAPVFKHARQVQSASCNSAHYIGVVKPLAAVLYAFKQAYILHHQPSYYM